MNGNGHHWRIKSYVKHISRGTCDCGAVRFFANDFSKESVKLVEDYNRKEGKEGSGHMVAQIESVKPEESAVVTEEAVVSDRGWYRSHKKEMIEDLITMGNDAFLEKWKVKRQIVSHLKSDDLYKSRVAQTEVPAKRGRKPKHSEVESPKSPPEPLEKMPFKLKVISAENKLLSLGTLTVEAASELPAFPEFNEQWSDYVKTNWFETYQALKELEIKQ